MTITPLLALAATALIVLAPLMRPARRRGRIRIG